MQVTLHPNAGEIEKCARKKTHRCGRVTLHAMRQWRHGHVSEGAFKCSRAKPSAFASSRIKCPNPMPGEESDLEIRPYYEAADFGEGFTPEEQAREADLRKRIGDV